MSDDMRLIFMAYSLTLFCVALRQSHFNATPLLVLMTIPVITLLDITLRQGFRDARMQEAAQHMRRPTAFCAARPSMVTRCFEMTGDVIEQLRRATHAERF